MLENKIKVLRKEGNQEDENLDNNNNEQINDDKI